MPLSVLFRAALGGDVLPQFWRPAIVVPDFKKGGKEDFKNCRPVSLTSVVCHVFEKIILFHLQNHFSFYKFLGPQQFGFVRGKSCISPLLCTINDLHSSLGQGKDVDCIYVDFHKAFDSVSIPKLLLKLSACRVGSSVLSCLKSFLVDHKLLVKVNDPYSDPGVCVSGVPQGSVLVPLLSCVYVNDLVGAMPHCVQTKLFTDDFRT